MAAVFAGLSYHWIGVVGGSSFFISSGLLSDMKIRENPCLCSLLLSFEEIIRYY